MTDQVANKGEHSYGWFTGHRLYPTLFVLHALVCSLLLLLYWYDGGVHGKFLPAIVVLILVDFPVSLILLVFTHSLFDDSPPLIVDWLVFVVGGGLYWMLVARLVRAFPRWPR